MTLIDAIHEGGVFKPTVPVNLPERAKVQLSVVEPRPLDAANEEAARRERGRKRIFEFLSRSYDTGQTDTAERHNEHQP
jgi:predicted DNA-binding antitoxin AbrB/MazE fold protein